MTLSHLSLCKCKRGTRKDAVPMVPNNRERILAYVFATRQPQPNTVDWQKVRGK